MKKNKPRKFGIIFNSLLVLAALLIFTILFIIDLYRISAGAMMPTLLEGDIIFVNQTSYGIRLFSSNHKLVETGKPKRGDVIVFQHPEEPSIPYIKRIVGLPGDHLRYHHIDKTLHINGRLVFRKFKGIYQGKGSGSNMTGSHEYVETLGKAKHSILLLPDRIGFIGEDGDQTLEIAVPKGEYFVFGDSRDNSRDSRYWGFVPEKNLIGRAFFILMNWRAGNWDRIGIKIK